MANDCTRLLRHKGNAQGASLSQGIDDELLTVVRVRRVRERRNRQGVDGPDIGW
jgi:hypothetical protein